MRPEARTSGIVVEEIDGEILVYDLARDEAHCLKDLTALVWRAADGHTPVDLIVERVKRQSTSAIADEDVRAALESLSDAHLLVSPIEWPRMGVAHIPEMMPRAIAVGAITLGSAMSSMVSPVRAQSAPPVDPDENR